MTPCPPTTAHLDTVRAGLARERLRTVCSRAGVSSDTRVTFSPSAMFPLSSAVLSPAESSSLVTTTTVMHGNTQSSVVSGSQKKCGMWRLEISPALNTVLAVLCSSTLFTLTRQCRCVYSELSPAGHCGRWLPWPGDLISTATGYRALYCLDTRASGPAAATCRHQ